MAKLDSLDARVSGSGAGTFAGDVFEIDTCVLRNFLIRREGGSKMWTSKNGKRVFKVDERGKAIYKLLNYVEFERYEIVKLMATAYKMRSKMPKDVSVRIYLVGHFPKCKKLKFRWTVSRIIFANVTFREGLRLVLENPKKYLPLLYRLNAGDGKVIIKV